MVQVIPFQRSAQVKRSVVRAETSAESEARRLNLDRKYGEESVYVREWRRRHEKRTDP